MLFLLNKTQPATMHLLQLFGGNQEKDVLLVEDAVYYATSFMVEKFKSEGVERVYALQDSIEERSLDPSAEVEVVDYDRIVDLLMEEYDKVVCI